LAIFQERIYHARIFLLKVEFLFPAYPDGCDLAMAFWMTDVIYSIVPRGEGKAFTLLSII